MKSVISVHAEVSIPKPPNYLRYGEEKHQVLDVSEINEEDLKKIGEAWTAQLIEHAKQRKGLKK